MTKITLEAGPARGVVEMIGFEYHLKGYQSGEALIEALQSSPYREVSIEVPRMAMPIRDLEL